MNPVTGAVPPLIRGHGIRFEVDRWTWRRLDAARFDGERRHLLATRGRPWHADPRHGGDTDALETWRLLAGRHQGGGMGLYDRGKQCLLAGKVTVKGAGGYPGLLHDLPQRGSKKPFFRKLIQSSLLYSF